jgi:hypothetical protein
MTIEFNNPVGVSPHISNKSPPQMRAEAIKLIHELVELGETLDQIGRPYKERIDELEHQKYLAASDLIERNDSILALITDKTREYHLESQAGSDLKTVVIEQADIDRVWLRNYYQKHPDSFLKKCVRLSEVASFSMHKEWVKPTLAIVFPFTSKSHNLICDYWLTSYPIALYPFFLFPNIPAKTGTWSST